MLLGLVQTDVDEGQQEQEEASDRNVNVSTSGVTGCAPSLSWNCPGLRGSANAAAAAVLSAEFGRLRDDDHSDQSRCVVRLQRMLYVAPSCDGVAQRVLGIVVVCVRCVQEWQPCAGGCGASADDVADLVGNPVLRTSAVVGAPRGASGPGFVAPCCGH